MFCFILGKHPRLSIAEIYALFPEGNIVFCSEKILVLENIPKQKVLENFHKMGGTIKIIEILKLLNENNFVEESINFLKSFGNNKKLNFAIASYGMNSFNNFKTGLEIKNKLKKGNPHIRLANKNNENINGAVYKKEYRGGNFVELNLMNVGNKKYFGATIIFQDVDEYSRRDINKIRDMDVGMMPPKLAQIMINISGKNNSIYDPFVGLGTILIESLNSGFKNIIGSDLDNNLIQKTQKNISNFIDNQKIKSSVNLFQMDVCNIYEILPKKINDLSGINIVTEGVLGDVITKNNISLEKILEQREKLKKLFVKFLGGLKKLNFKGSIVISFPFWELNGKYIYFEEVYKILEENSFKIQKLLPQEINLKETKVGSLLYKREDQFVGREIFKLSL